VSETLGPGPRTRVRRLPEKARYDEETIYAILDEARLCHVAATLEGRAVCLPTLHAREGRRLYLHSSRSSALANALLDEGVAWVSATIYDGLRLARSGFESSIAYRSVVVSGPVRDIEDEGEKRRVLDLFVDAVLPGRSAEVREATDREIRLTRVLEVTIEEASAKVSAGPTDDDEADQALAIWSGVVPAALRFAEPQASRDGAMAAGTIPLPASVRRLLDS
jgi:uncharacterized protein